METSQNSGTYNKHRAYKEVSNFLGCGMTVLGGCNEYGRSLYIRLIKGFLEYEGIPFVYFNNEYAKSMNHHNVAEFNALCDLCKEKAKAKSDSGIDEFWILLDHFDEGLSVDRVEDLKLVLRTEVISQYPDVDIYIVVNSNNFEMFRNQRCLDIYAKKEMYFLEYEDFASYVRKARKFTDMDNLKVITNDEKNEQRNQED